MVIDALCGAISWILVWQDEMTHVEIVKAVCLCVCVFFFDNCAIDTVWMWNLTKMVWFFFGGLSVYSFSSLWKVLLYERRFVWLVDGTTRRMLRLKLTLLKVS